MDYTGPDLFGDTIGLNPFSQGVVQMDLKVQEFLTEELGLNPFSQGVVQMDI